MNETDSEYIQKLKERRKIYNTRNLTKNYQNIRISKNAYYRKIRKGLMDILGGPICIKCGFSDIRALQLDHINGGGLAEVRQKGCNANIYLYYLKHPEEAKQVLQVLCANCNWIKRHTNNEKRQYFPKSVS